jgi:tetratricopeptide (TPR) repeat protein
MNVALIGSSRRHVLTCALLLTLAWPASAQEKKAATYAFTAAPLEILDRLGELQMGAVPKISAEERALLTTVWAMQKQTPRGKADEKTLLDAMLFASGVEEAAARKAFAEKYAQLAAAVKDAVKSSETDYQRGETLMSFLHKRVLSKGYQENQTLWHTVFETGQYNCVSATAVVYMVGTHIGLELKPLSIPGTGFTAGHATLDMRDADKWLQVEATNRDGFDWQKKVNRPGVIVLGLIPDRKQAHEVDGLGVAAMIYSNRAVAVTKGKGERDPLQAARLYLAALALNPTDVTSTHNFTGLFVNWTSDLAKARKFEDALRVVSFALTLAPKTSDLHNNHAFAWSSYIRSLLDEGKDEEAVRVVARAGKAIPKDSDFRGAASWFERHGEQRRKDRGWEAALEVVERGLRVLPPAEAKRLLEWRTGVYRRWSQKLLADKDVDGSLNVLAKAYALEPKDRALADGIRYHTGEALTLQARDKDLKPAIEHYQEIRRRFPDAASAEEAAWSFAVRRVEALAKEKKYAEAVAAVTPLEPLVGPKKLPELGGHAYDRWARTFMDRKDWEGAIRIYQDGLKAYPNESLMKNNLDYCKSKIKKK